MQRTANNVEGQFNWPAQVSDDELYGDPVYQRPAETVMYPSEVSTEDQMNIVEASGVLDFWDDPAEDVYDKDDEDAV